MVKCVPDEKIRSPSKLELLRHLHRFFRLEIRSSQISSCGLPIPPNHLSRLPFFTTGWPSLSLKLENIDKPSGRMTFGHLGAVACAHSIEDVLNALALMSTSSFDFLGRDVFELYTAMRARIRRKSLFMLILFGGSNLLRIRMIINRKSEEWSFRNLDLQRMPRCVSCTIISQIKHFAFQTVAFLTFPMKSFVAFVSCSRAVTQSHAQRFW